jgi:TetR/AcrR family transcriptional repressor of uid operon
VAAEPLRLLVRALDRRVEPPDDAMSERILDAALSLAAASGIRNLTMDDVARRAGVGRMTVYRRFGEKAQLVDALAVREARRVLDELDRAAPPDAPIEEQVVEGFVTSLRLSREHPLLSRLARFEAAGLLATISADGQALFAAGRAFAAARLRAAQDAGVLGEVPVDEVAEVLVRLAASFVLIPETVLPVDDDERLRELARAVVAPILTRAAGPGG